MNSPGQAVGMLRSAAGAHRRMVEVLHSARKQLAHGADAAMGELTPQRTLQTLRQQAVEHTQLRCAAASPG